MHSNLIGLDSKSLIFFLLLIQKFWGWGTGFFENETKLFKNASGFWCKNATSQITTFCAQRVPFCTQLRLLFAAGKGALCGRQKSTRKTCVFWSSRICSLELNFGATGPAAVFLELKNVSQKPIGFGAGKPIMNFDSDFGGENSLQNLIGF